MQISISCVYVSINFLFNLFLLVVAMFKCYVFSVGQKLTGLCWFVEPHPTKRKNHFDFLYNGAYIESYLILGTLYLLLPAMAQEVQ